MQIGFVGLGKMGGNMVHASCATPTTRCVGLEPRPGRRRGAPRSTAATAPSRSRTSSQKLDKPRNVWLMIPAGGPTQETIDQLLGLLDEGDIDHRRRQLALDRLEGQRRAPLGERGIQFMDVGTSGGVWGLEVGYCMMVGGTDEAVERMSPILDVLAPPDGWGHMGPAGAGHYVKMVHNGVEYGMMQAYAEGFEIMHASEYDLDIAEIAHLWTRARSCARGCCELPARPSSRRATTWRHPRLRADSGEGRWTVFDAIDIAVPAPVHHAVAHDRASPRARTRRTRPRSTPRCATSSAGTR